MKDANIRIKNLRGHHCDGVILQGGAQDGVDDTYIVADADVPIFFVSDSDIARGEQIRYGAIFHPPVPTNTGLTVTPPASST